MIDMEKIRNDLKDIRYYVSRKKVFDANSDFVGVNNITEKLKMYNDAVCSASPRLYDIYVSLYLNNQTQESLSEILGYSFQTISRLNVQLLNHFYKKLNENVA